MSPIQRETVVTNPMVAGVIPHSLIRIGVTSCMMVAS